MIYDPYINEYIHETESSLEHIFPEALGGVKGFSINEDGRKNKVIEYYKKNVPDMER